MIAFLALAADGKFFKFRLLAFLILGGCIGLEVLWLLESEYTVPELWFVEGVFP